MSSAGLSDEIIIAANNAINETLPIVSKDRYEKMYAVFQQWKTENQKIISRPLYMHYYSMVKTIIRLKEKIDIGGFHELTAFLKRKANGYVPVKSEPFEDFEVEQFLSEADDSWLDVKVVCIFGVCGALRGIELTKLTIQHVKEYGSLYLVNVKETKNKKDRTFTITGSLYDIVKKYANLRPPKVDTDRFFLNYQNGKCTCQVIGKQKFALMLRRIAQFLQLSNPDNYTGHSFRRSSASILANTGASIDNVKNHGGWSSSKVAEGYIENSFAYKK